MKVFPHADVEEAIRPPQVIKDYIYKEGAYLEDPKRAEYIEGFQLEYGTLPKGQGQRSDLKPFNEAVEMVNNGASLNEVYLLYPTCTKHHAALEKYARAYEDKHLKNKPIKKECYYLQGTAGTGKTTDVITTHGADLYQIDYQAGKNFHYNGYDGENNILFDEFSMQVSIDELLRQLNDFVFKVNVKNSYRYCIATKFYFLSNRDFATQYAYLKEQDPKTYNAFLRRFNEIRDYGENGNISIYKRVKIKNPKDLYEYDYLCEDVLYFHKFDKFKMLEEKSAKGGYDMIEFITNDEITPSEEKSIFDI